MGMGSSNNILIIMVIMVIVSMALAADDPQATLLGPGCSDEILYTYKNFTAFNENRATVFRNLASNLSSNGSGFATSTSSKGTTDPVYGLVQCRKYLTVNECMECFNEAQKQIQDYCPRSNGARIHFDGCFLRYENTSFFGQDTDPGFSNSCASIYDTQPEEFSERAQTLLSELITNASASNGYAVGSFDSLYGVAQCWDSVANIACQGCLQAARDILIQNCVPRQEGRGLQAGCFMRYATYSFYSDNITSSLSENHSKGKSKLLPILLGSIGGAALIAALCFVVICIYYRERFQSYFPTHAEKEEDVAARETLEQVLFDYDVLRDATADFDVRNLLGKGGFGAVYKGTLVDGRVIAVKKLAENHTTKAMGEFLTEVKVISSVRHRNLVRLLGCCIHGHERLLVYEFMPNNSLDKHIFGDVRNHLDWNIRFNIIVGSARGLSYLHEDSNIRIVHRDIKPGNILLDENFHPKIADFGLAKFFPEGESQVSTRFGGTIGYTAPEYITLGLLSEKVDVYSYGVVVLEIISGRKWMDTKLAEPMHLLLQWVWGLYENDRVLDMVDPKLEGNYTQDQMQRVILIALLCTQESSNLRPIMSQIFSMLTNDSEISDRPTKPTFVDTYLNGRPATSTSQPPSSHGSITVSLFPR